jgi:acetyltransferase-like isoleucine patch superfamily enzyme
MFKLTRSLASWIFLFLKSPRVALSIPINGCFIYPGASITLEKNSRLVANGHIEVHAGAAIYVREGRYLELGSNVCIHKGAIIDTSFGSIKIGNNVSVNPYSILYGHGGLSIGSNVRIAAHCVFVPANHGFKDKNTLIMNQEVTAKGIVVEDNVWFGARCVILDGVRVGHSSVVGAGSLVSRDVPSHHVSRGIPSKSFHY